MAVPLVARVLLIAGSDKLPENQQDVVSVEDQVSVEGLPATTVVGEKESVGAETDPAVTVKVAEAGVLVPPLEPEQVRL